MSIPSITGAILAGGQATRMGGADKGLILLDGIPLYQHVLKRIQPQVKQVVISANRNIEEYEQSGCAVFSDSLSGFKGPLAGMLTILENSPTEWVLFSSCDTPLIPQDLAQRLWLGKNNQLAAYAHDGDRAHPTIALLNTQLVQPLRNYLLGGDRKLMIFLSQQQATAVNFQDNPQAFKNINTLDECKNWNQ
ncbi:molybdopterin-guanine dinucleotide biosynthesis protein MobA [Pragia fontium]|uniref:Molybdenum cofactor guanylyltransferase n=1 Tax=Pragia fontium TaxID=82985 RepID=A0ABQ5LL21_9GAMM|nr:molybdenum cofactor guanylyltransferase MobA [Pragia fontium]AKJ43621.1 molybdopterin-guanine dinucleotide biosynthesis protein MobA [Pragia fontium]GKX64322.1 molybdenum cofactor guanylyltransferase [Pragia fontium]SUB84118.1 molybdopterin-guanine dinucleotide biosynthesis protein MobA [Pragia fontium]